MFCNFGPNWDQIGGFSLLGWRIRRSPALAKDLLILSSTARKNQLLSLLVDSPNKFLSFSTKYQFPCFNPIKLHFWLFTSSNCCCTIFILTLYSLYTQIMLILILTSAQCLQNVVFSFEKGSGNQNHSSSDSQNSIKILFVVEFAIALSAIW